ncbi:MAG: hypothetical protein ACFCA4_12715 [Cyanophyceae cyanobacterium]
MPENLTTPDIAAIADTPLAQEPLELDVTVDDGGSVGQAIAQLRAGYESLLAEADRIETAINAVEPVQFSVSSLTKGEVPRVTALCDGKFAIEIDAGVELGQGVVRAAILCPLPTEAAKVEEVLAIWGALLSLYPGPRRQWLVSTLLLVGRLRKDAEELAIATETEFTGLAEQSLTVEDYQYTLHSDPSGRLWTLSVKYLHP